MANEKIHEYIDEQITPQNGDFMDIDADQGGGSYLSKKLSLLNLKNWLLSFVKQPLVDLGTQNGLVNIDLSTGNHFELIVDGNTTIGFINPPSGTYGATWVVNLYQDGIGGHTVIFAGGVLTPENIATVSDGGNEYSQIWLSWNGSNIVANVTRNIS